jgi:hypothetical protein
MESEWDHITARVSHGRLVFDGIGELPDCDLGMGLRVVLDMLRAHGWEIDPDQCATAGAVLLRRRATGRSCEDDARMSATN